MRVLRENTQIVSIIKLCPKTALRYLKEGEV